MKDGVKGGRNRPSPPWALILLGLAVTGAALVLACRETNVPTAPVEGPEAQIKDAVHSGGKPHFYFLPPMVSAPAYSGTFDPTLAPTVQICVYVLGDCSTVIAQYTTTTGPGSETVRLDATNQLYIVNWRTDQFRLDPALTYRVRVLVGTLELGFADVDVVSTTKELRTVNTSQFVPLLNGTTLAIKARIEQGVVALVTVAPSDATVVAALTQQFTATLTDLHGNALSGPAIVWASSAPAVATVDQTGLATGVTTGVATISASAAGVTGSARLTVTVSTAKSSVTTSSASIASGSTATLTLQAKDAAGNNLNTTGLTVVFSASGPTGASTGTIGSTTDNGNGTYTATFTGVLAGTPTSIGATINGTAVTSTLPTITVTPGPASKATSVVTTSAASVVSGTAATLTLQAKDAAGNKLTTGGLTVGFTASGGTSTGTIGATTDNGNGTYIATFTGVLAGTATTIGATIGGNAVTTPRPTIVVTVGPVSAATSLITTSTASVISGNTATLTLVAKDAAGNNEPTGGLVVAFTASGGTSTGTIGATTDNGNGTYTATFTGVGTGTPTTIGATIGGTPVTSTLPTISVASGSPSTATSVVSTSAASITSGTTATLTLQVKDAAGNNLITGGLAVAFTTSSGSGVSTGTIGPTTDNGNGTYAATFTGVLAGTATSIGATMGGIAVSSTLPTIIVTPGAASTATSVVSTSSGTIVSGSSATLTLQVKDAAGNSLTMGGLAVVFTASGGTSTGTIDPTSDNGNGTYSATFTGVLAGTATSIGATIGGNAVTTAHPTIAVTVGAVSPARSIITASSATVMTGSSATLTLQAKDAAGNNETTGGLVVVFTASGGTSTGTLGATTDNGNGTYTASFTGVAAGTPTTIGATIGGTPVTSTLPTIGVTPNTVVVMVDERIVISDEAKVVPPASVAVTEAVRVSDAEKVLPPIGVSVTEAVAVSDRPAVLPPIQVSIGEALRVADQPAVLPSISIAVTESIMVTDASAVAPQ